MVVLLKHHKHFLEQANKQKPQYMEVSLVAINLIIMK